MLLSPSPLHHLSSSFPSPKHPSSTSPSGGIMPCCCRSSMGGRAGFMGASVVPFVIMICIARKTKPRLMIHECTRSFKWKVWEAQEGDDGEEFSFFPGYECHHLLTSPLDYGQPVHRSRSYSALIRPDSTLDGGLTDLWRLYLTPTIDCRAFLGAPDDEAHQFQLPMPIVLGLIAWAGRETWRFSRRQQRALETSQVLTQPRWSR